MHGAPETKFTRVGTESSSCNTSSKRMRAATLISSKEPRPSRSLRSIDAASSSQVGISRLCTRTRSIKIAETRKLPTRNERPALNDRVRVSKYPTMNGPTNPPRFPTELMSPMEAAAADSVRNSVGTGQKAGVEAEVRPTHSHEEQHRKKDIRSHADCHEKKKSAPHKRNRRMPATFTR